MGGGGGSGPPVTPGYIKTANVFHHPVSTTIWISILSLTFHIFNQIIINEGGMKSNATNDVKWQLKVG